MFNGLPGDFDADFLGLLLRNAQLAFFGLMGQVTYSLPHHHCHMKCVNAGLKASGVKGVQVADTKQ